MIDDKVSSPQSPPNPPLDNLIKDVFGDSSDDNKKKGSKKKQKRLTKLSSDEIEWSDNAESMKDSNKTLTKDVTNESSTVKTTSPLTNSLKLKSTKGKSQKKFVIVSKSSSTYSTTDNAPKQIPLEEEEDSMDDLPLSEVKKIMIERAKKDDTTSKIKSTRTVKKTCQTQVEKPVDEVKKTSSNSKGMSLRKERKANIPFTLTQDPNNPKKYIQSNQSIKISDSTIIPLKSVSSNKKTTPTKQASPPPKELMAIYECGDTDMYVYDDGSKEDRPCDSPIPYMHEGETPSKIAPYYDPLNSSIDTSTTVCTNEPSSIMAAAPGQFYFDLAQASWKQRKDTTLKEAEKAYKDDNNVEAYKKKVSEFAFPNANTSSRITSFLKKIDEDNARIEILSEKVHGIDERTSIPKNSTNSTIEAAARESIADNVSVKISSIEVDDEYEKSLDESKSQPSLLKDLDLSSVKSHIGKDVISDMSDREILESSLPTKRNAEKAILNRPDSRDRQADSRSRKSNSMEKDNVNIHFSAFKSSRNYAIRDTSRDYSPEAKYRPKVVTDKQRGGYRGRSREDRFDNQSRKPKYDANLSRRGKPKTPQTSFTSRERELAEREKKIHEEEMRLERSKIEEERKALKAERALYEKEKKLEAKEKSLPSSNNTMNYPLVIL